MAPKDNVVMKWDGSKPLGVSDMPSTRYQGSKRKILPWIWDKLQDLGFSSVLDVFGGTGVVSYLFKRMGKRVTYNDYMRWNYQVGVALIENNLTQLSSAEVEMLTQPVSRNDAAFVSQAFRGIYFTEQENLWIDAIAARSCRLKGTDTELRFKRAVAHYALFQTCLVKRPFNLFHRRNMPLRQANVARSFGNKITWDTPFAVHFRSFADEIGRHVFHGLQICRALNHDALDIPAGDYDLVYLDPPYLRRQTKVETADYLHCYHFLEGLARYDEWPQLIDYSSRLRSFDNPQANAWADPARNGRAFEALLDKFPHSIIGISYKKFGRPSVDTLVRLLKRRGKAVRVYSKHYKYALNHQNGSAKLNRECLIIGE